MTIDPDPEVDNGPSVAIGTNEPLPGLNAMADAVRLLGDVVKNEESRFSNLNTRGVAVVSATSLVTAVAGFFSKDLLGTTLRESARVVGGVGTILTLGLLVLTAYRIVFEVLKPRRRLVFGNNALLDDPVSLVDAYKVNTIAYLEYRAIFTGLVERNDAKAKGLTSAYKAFFSAVSLIALTSAAVLLATYFEWDLWFQSAQQ